MNPSAPETQPIELEIKRILLLDDDIELADALKRLLEARNYVVTTVKNGMDGLLEVMALYFDVIICDIMMPSMAGDMFYLAVERTKPQLQDRFIFVTAHAEDPKVNEFLEKTDAQVLTKPVDTDELIRAISLVLKRTHDAEKARLAD